MNFLERLWVAIKPSEAERMKYIYKHNLFDKIGEGCMFVPRVLPPEPEYIRLGDNVVVAARVTFITHDVSHLMYNSLFKTQLMYFHGCIKWVIMFLLDPIQLYCQT